MSPRTPGPPDPGGLTVLDLYPAFERFWREVHARPVREQVDRWEHQLMAPWPELLARQVRNYAEEGVDWRRVARGRVFPRLKGAEPVLRLLHRELRTQLPTGWAKARRDLGLHGALRAVVHVGIGCGAGWATEYAGEPALLFGLENAADLVRRGGGPYSMTSLLAHELAHLGHRERRAAAGLRPPREETPFWHLYEEGFATAYERSAVPPAHFAARTGAPGWLRWCESHRSRIARRFLAEADRGNSARDLFGSWYGFGGYPETGYYLGAEVVRAWLGSTSLDALAVLSPAQVGRRVRATVEALADGSPATASGRRSPRGRRRAAAASRAFPGSARARRT
jgi:hypothetical protein